MSWLDGVTNAVNGVVNGVGNAFNRGFDVFGNGLSNATGMSNASQYTPYGTISAPQVDSSALNAQIANNAGIQKQQNVSGYNAAVASQAGINPALAASMMGNNLAMANQQTAANTANLQAQTGFQGALANQQAQAQTNALNSANYNAAMSGNAQASESAANRGAGFIGGLFGGLGGLFASSDERMKQAPGTSNSGNSNFPSFDFHNYFMGNAGQVSPTQFNSNIDQNSQQAGNSMQAGLTKFGQGIGDRMKMKSSGGEEMDTGLTPEFAEAAPETFDYLSGLSAALSSDMRNKNAPQQLSEHSKTIESFLDTLRPYAYEYKPGTVADDGGQKHLGVMAQNLEKTQVGDNAVMDTPQGKMVDIKQLSSLMAAGLGNIHERLSKLEGMRNG